MTTWAGKFTNDSGIVEMQGTFTTLDTIAAGVISGTAIGNAATAAGQLLKATGASNAQWGTLLTDVAAPPVAYVTPLVFDHTATTGGLYAWDSVGAAYVKVGLATS